ncbi:MAG: substrate-binding domain-containing protein [Candidatus Promineifilaceae bacterium]|nr:substrate-binding domain-containing protein [Candidatus Promineifilaceae bacterium]
MPNRTFRGLILLITMLSAAALACSLNIGDGPPNNAVIVRVVANASLEDWLTQAATDFNERELETSEGRPAYVELELVEAGRFVADVANGEALPDIWIPDQEVWTGVLAEQGYNEFSADCQSVAESPLVIAMWRQVAQSLGWPGLDLGWLDVGSLAADPSAWAYYSGGEFGDSLRLGHTHPGLSGSGAATLLAIVQAAEAQREAVTPADIAQPIVQASVSAFEAAVATFASNTVALGVDMSERGPAYLGAAVMYENIVVTEGQGNLVPIYPLEGTFVATHPACISAAANPELGEAADLFRAFLLEGETQQAAVANGLRPVVDTVSLATPLVEANGVEASEPERVFASPSVDTIYAVQELWQAARKDVNLVMLIDVSGSMRGDKIDNVRRAAVEFVQQMGDDDLLTIIAFSHELTLLSDHTQVGPNREALVNAIRSLDAAGDTALYDAIGLGAEQIAATSAPDTANALVVLTDGQDTFSFRYTFNQSLIDLAAANDTTVFTIAYGDDADRDILETLALGANGNFYLGDAASIAAIYEEMSAAFGGTVGVGR